VDIFTKRDLQELLSPPSMPCVSLYLPTQRGGSEQVPIRWKNLLHEAETYLVRGGLHRGLAEELLAPARERGDDLAFWHNQSDGLACFLARGLSRFFRLPVPFAEQAIVADGFHIKPLLPLLSEDGRFLVLAISRNRVRLLQGTHFSVEEIDAKSLPRGLEEALRFHDRDEPLIFHTHPSLGFGRWGAIFHGHGVGIDDVKKDLHLYFQKIDRGLHEMLREERAPVVLASVEYLWPLYREVNTYAHLLEGGIAGCPDHLTPQELHDRAWPLVQPVFQARRHQALALYARLEDMGGATDDLGNVIVAAQQGKVEMLLATRGSDCWGTFDPVSGTVTVHDTRLSGDVELVNLAARYTLLHKGTVHLIPPEEVPLGAMLPAAVYWLPHARKNVG